MRDGKRRKTECRDGFDGSPVCAAGRRFSFSGLCAASWAGQAAAVGVSGKSGNGGEPPGESTPPDENLPADLDSLPGSWA